MPEVRRVAEFGGVPFQGTIYQSEALTSNNFRIPEDVVARQLSNAFSRLQIDHEIHYGFDPVSLDNETAVCGGGPEPTAAGVCDYSEFDPTFDEPRLTSHGAKGEFADYLRGSAPMRAEDSNLILTNAGGGGCGGVGGDLAAMGAAQIDFDPLLVVEAEDSDWAGNVLGAMHEVGHNLGYSHANHGGWAENRDGDWHKTPTVASNDTTNVCNDPIPLRQHDSVVKHLYFHDCVGETLELVDKQELVQEPATAEFEVSTAGLGATFNADASYGGGGVTGYEWSFGDGQTGTGSYASHTYDAPGTYTATLNIDTFSGETDSVTETFSVSYPDTDGPTAVAKASTDRMVATLDGRASVSDVGIEAYRWDVGTGQTTTGELTTWQYAQEGQYTVELTVEDTQGRTDTDTTTLSVTRSSRDGVQADFSASTAGLDVVLNAGASTAPGGVASYQWTFGDGGTASGETVEHTFPAAGSWSVTLTAEGADGGVDSVTKDVVVVEDGGSAAQALMGVAALAAAYFLFG